MFDLEKLADAILQSISDPINRLSTRLKVLEEKPFPKEEDIVKAVIASIDPTLVQWKKLIDELLEGILDARKAISELPDEDLRPELDHLKATVYKIEEVVLSSQEAISQIKIPEFPELPDFSKMVQELVKSQFEVSVQELTPVVEERAPDIEELLPHLEKLVSQAVSGYPQLIAEMIAKEVQKFPTAKDGVGLAGALIDRNNNLIVTFTDGGSKNLGSVVGKDADMDLLSTRVDQLVSAIPVPKDGLGFDDLTVDYDQARTFSLKFARGSEVKQFTFKVPVMIYQGVYQIGEKYQVGDVVTWAGGMWHCNLDTENKPGDGNPEWTLAVKRGRSAKEPVPLTSSKPPIVKV